MFRRYYFSVFVVCTLVGLGQWANRLNVAAVGASISTAVEKNPSKGGGHVSESSQRQLLEVLDRLVVYEHYYRSVYGHFTKFLGRTGLTIPQSVSKHFEIRVIEASDDRLLISAFSETGGKIADQVSINEDFKVRANFRTPQPQPKYLVALAKRHLRILRDAPAGRLLEEAGVFRGFFRYEVKSEPENAKTVLAVGIKPPVLGIQLELTDKYLTDVTDPLPGDIGEEVVEFASRTGQQSTGNTMTDTLEEAYLAQRIFHGEMGRYAKDWSELSKIAHFQFEAKDLYEGIPFDEKLTGLTAPVDYLTEPQTDTQTDPPSSETGKVTNRRVSSFYNGLKIEPIGPEQHPEQHKNAHRTKN